MNIGIFTDSYTPIISGVVTSTKILKEELEALGHKVTIVTVKHPDLKVEEPDILRLPSLPFLPVKTQRVGSIYSTKVWRKIKKLNLDIIHTQTEFSIGLFGRIVAKRLGIPVVHTYHTMYEDYVHYIAPSVMVKRAAGVAKKVSKAYCKDCNAVIVPTSKVREKLQEYGLKHDHVEVIPTGMVLEPFKRENQDEEQIDRIKQELNISNDDKIVLFIGRIAKEKSIDTVMKAVDKIAKEDPEVKMVIVGDGPELPNLKSFAKELEHGERFIFAGERPWSDIGKYYALGDVFVSASVTETQGLTFTEAMAAKIAVVAKYDKNLEDIIKDRENGLIFREDKDLEELLKKVLNDKAFKDEIINSAYDGIEPLSSTTFGRNVSNLYKEIIEECREIKQTV